MRRIVTALVIALVTVFAWAAQASATTYAPIVGEGSAAGGAIVDDWRAAAIHQGLAVNYAPTGNSAGLTGFANGGDDFAVTDLPYGISGATPTAPSKAFGYAPLTASAVSLMYNLSVNGQQVTNLRLSPTTIAGIFAGTITNWDDSAITADNGGNTLPSLAITPVVRSDAAGSTDALTKWLTAVAPSAWTCGETVFFTSCPAFAASVQQAKSGDNGVAAFVGQAANNGSIGYVDYAYGLVSGYPAASVLNASGHYVQPSAEATSSALAASTVSTGALLDLSGAYTSTDTATYPVVMPIYAVLPTDTSSITVAKGQALADFITFDVCGGQADASTLGMAPLTPNLVADTFSVLHELSTANSEIDTSAASLSNCSANPTFVINNVSPPTFSGTVKAGDVVTASPGTWTNSPTSYTYQWMANGYPISGATHQTYTIARTLGAKYLSVMVTAHRAGFAFAEATSASQRVPLVPFIELTAPHLYGTLRVGYTAHVYLGHWNPTATSTGISWYVNGVRVEVNRTYLVLTRRMAGARIRVVLRLARSGYVTRTVTLNGAHAVWR